MLGFVLNMLTFAILKLSSSLLLKGVSVARTAGLVIYCAMFRGEHITGAQAFGYSISLACFAVYNYIRAR